MKATAIIAGMLGIALGACSGQTNESAMGRHSNLSDSPCTPLSSDHFRCTLSASYSGEDQVNDTDGFKAISDAVNALPCQSDHTTVDIVLPAGTFIVGKQVVTNGATSSVYGEAFHAEPVPIIRVTACGTRTINLAGAPNMGTTLKGDTSTSLLYGAFTNTTPAQPFSTGTGEGFRATPYYAMIDILGNESVSIQDLKLIGNIDTVTVGGTYSDTGYQIPANGIRLVQNGRALIKNVESSKHPEDGITINNQALGSTEPPPAPHILINFRAEGNGRQGLTWEAGNGLLARKSHFSRNGTNARISSKPRAGIDLEVGGGRIRNGVFDECYVVDNAGTGIVSDVSDDDKGTEREFFVSDITIKNSVIWGSRNYTIWIVRPGLRVEDSRIYGAIPHVYGAVRGDADASRFVRTTIDDRMPPDDVRDLYPDVTRTSYADWVIGDVKAGATFDGCTIIAGSIGLIDANDYSNGMILRNSTLLSLRHSRPAGAAPTLARLRNALLENVKILVDNDVTEEWYVEDWGVVRCGVYLQPPLAWYGYDYSGGARSVMWRPATAGKYTITGAGIERSQENVMRSYGDCRRGGVDFDGSTTPDWALVGDPAATSLPVATLRTNDFTTNDFTYSTGSSPPSDGRFFSWLTGAGASRAVGDFNGDGLTDIAAVGGAWSEVAIARGSSALAGGMPVISSTGTADFQSWSRTAGVSRLVGDFNGDGRADIALTGATGWTVLPVAYGSSNGFTVKNTDPVGGPWGDYASRTDAQGRRAEPIIGDFDGDGRSDILLWGATLGWGTMPIAFGPWYFPNQDPVFVVKNRLESCNSAIPISSFLSFSRNLGAKRVVGDFNGDGRTDLALVGGSERTSISTAFAEPELTQCNGAWTEARGTFRVINGEVDAAGFNMAADGGEVFSGDFDGDRKSDVAVLLADKVHFARSKGDGKFTLLQVTSSLGGTQRVSTVVADIDNDGRKDFILLKTDGSVVLGLVRKDWTVELHTTPAFDAATVASNGVIVGREGTQ